MAQASHMLSVNVGDGNAQSGNIIGCFNNTVYKSDEDAQIMRWLSPLEPKIRHQDVRTERFDGVGDWLLETSEFREWRSSEGGDDKAVLFCSGNPGVGKTYLSSLVIDSLCDQAKDEDIAVAGLYYDYSAEKDQTIINTMGAILKQLVGRGDIPEYLREAFHQSKKEFGGRGLRLGDLMRMLRTTIASLPRVFICIDALDECVPKYLPELLKSLRDIVQGSPRTRIFLTGRPHVRDDIRRYFPKAVVIPISPNTADIKNYLDMKLDGDADPEAMSDDLRADIVRIILERISDTFLLVSLNIDAILGEVTIRRRREKLEGMTRGNGLSDAYTATLARLKSQKGNRSTLGLKVLMWVLYSEKPLRSEELRHALGVEIGSTDLDVENLPALRTLLSSCLGLVTFEASSSTVRLVHFTLREHLSSDPTLFQSPHSTIAEVCLTYLNFGYVRGLSPTLYSAPPTMPFLGYASLYWGKHTSKGVTESVKVLALKLLDKFDEHISAQLLLLRYNQDTGWGPYFDGVGGPARFTGLHGAAFLGIAEIVAAVLVMKEWDINAADDMGGTALTWSTRRGYEEVVKVLLEREDVNPNQADTFYGQKPLFWATEYGHHGIVKALLEREDVNPNQPDTKYGQTPLTWAARRGHDRVVKTLLEREDVNPDQPDTKYGQTPLFWATEYAHHGIVKTLLEREDVNPNQPDTKYGQTPISWAAKHGDNRAVRALLERADVNPDHPDTKYGKTPLSWAAEYGHYGVVKTLLEREDVNPDQPDTEYGKTPLSWAARCGRDEVVKALLAREDVKPDQPDTEYGQTPLSWAARCGRDGVVKTLLERADVNPDQPDTKYGKTPLSWAAEYGHYGVVKTLLRREDVNPNKPDTFYGRTPLSWAATYGHDRVVGTLLKPEHVNPNQPDTFYGRTPLSWAATYGHDGVVKTLLRREDVNPNQPDTKYGRTPLFWAAEHGYGGVVKILLERKDVSAVVSDIDNQTPLSLALSKGHDRVVSILLERGHVDSVTEADGGQPSLPPSTGHGEECVIEMQSNSDDPNTHIIDLNYQPAPPPADPDQRQGEPDHKRSVSKPADRHLSSTEPPNLVQSLPVGSSHPSSETNTHSSPTQPILSFPVDRYSVIASLMCLFAFLLYILPFSLLDIFPFHK